MEFSRELLFFFSALGAFNGLMMGLYFLCFLKPRNLTNLFLGGLLLALSIRIGKSVFFYFNSELAGFYLQFGLSACFLIGPFLYFFLKSITHPKQVVSKQSKSHFIIWSALILIINLTTSFYDDFPLWQNYFIPFIYLQWLGYVIFSGFLVRKIYKTPLKNQSKFITSKAWTLSIWAGNVVIWIAYNSCPYGSYILGALSFSFLFYLLILLLVLNRKKTSQKIEQLPKYLNKKIESSEANILLNELNRLMNHQKLYKNAHLKLPDVADKMDIKPHRLSQLLNDNLGKNFPRLYQ